MRVGWRQSRRGRGDGSESLFKFRGSGSRDKCRSSSRTLNHSLQKLAPSLSQCTYIRLYIMRMLLDIIRLFYIKIYGYILFYTINIPLSIVIIRLSIVIILVHTIICWYMLLYTILYYYILLYTIIYYCILLYTIIYYYILLYTIIYFKTYCDII